MKISDLVTIKGTPLGTLLEQGAPATGRVPQEALQLTPGQLLLARVVGMADGGRAQLSILGQTVTAESTVPLPVGSDVWLEVKQGGDHPWFVLADKKGAASEVLRTMLADGPALGRALRGLQDFTGLPRPAALATAAVSPLETLLASMASLAVDGRPAPEALLHLLALLQGAGGQPGKGQAPQRLSGQLAEMLTAVRQDGAPLAAGAKGGDLARLGTFLEQLAHLNAQPSSHDQSLFFLFPCFFSGAAGWGEWLVSLDDGRASNDKAPTMALEFFLEMSSLGDVHLRFTVAGQGVQGEIDLANEEIRDHVEAMLPELTAALEKMGHGPLTIRCRTAPRSHLQHLKEAMTDKARLRDATLFHITA